MMKKRKKPGINKLNITVPDDYVFSMNDRISVKNAKNMLVMFNNLIEDQQAGIDLMKRYLKILERNITA